MPSSRSIIRGTFRISIVVAIVAAIYSAYGIWTKNQQAWTQHYKLEATLRCGSVYSAEELKPHRNEFGNFDLSKVGCSDRVFWASLEEMRAVAGNGKLRGPFYLPPAYSWEQTAVDALLAFIAVNLIGFIVVGTRRIWQWIADGFKTIGG